MVLRKHFGSKINLKSISNNWSYQKHVQREELSVGWASTIAVLVRVYPAFVEMGCMQSCRLWGKHQRRYDKWDAAETRVVRVDRYISWR